MPACFRPCALASAIGTTLALFNAAHAAERTPSVTPVSYTHLRAHET